MSPTTPFRRANRPEEIEVRRETLLAAAAALFDEEGPQGTGLNAIAARAGFTKSNVYRYFESREDVLLHLFRMELDRFVVVVETGIGACAEHDLDALAGTMADAFAAHPRFCALLSIVSGVLERNVSEAAMMSLKRTIMAANVRFAMALEAKLPGVRVEDCSWVAAMAAMLLAGIWPGVHPSPVAAKVLETPEFEHLKPRLDRDLKRGILALLASVAKP